MRDFTTLKVWQAAHQLALDTYRVTQNFPREELYGITNQIRRASVSVPANLAEGFSREGDRERAHFVNIAIGSMGEVQYFLLLSRDLGFLANPQFDKLRTQAQEV